MVRKEVILSEYERTKHHIHVHPKPVSALLASIIGALADMSLITQGSLGFIVEHTAPRLFAIMEKEGYVRRGMSSEDLVKSVMEFLGFDKDSYSFEFNGNKLVLEVVTDKCVIDPVSVGGAELHGTLCPLPYLMASFLMINDGRTWIVEVVRKGAHVYVVEKKDGKCLMTLKVA